MVFVLTVDQQRSTTAGSRAKSAVDDLTERLGSDLLLPIGRFAGDELQLIFAEAEPAAEVALDLADSGWHVGIGAGEGTLGSDAADSHGPAFTLAREAVDAAKTLPWHLAVRATDAGAAEDAEAAFALVLGIRSRRTSPGREIAELIAELGSTTAAAEHLGISVSAASKRARVAMVRHDEVGTRLAKRLLAAVSDQRESL